MTKPWEATVPKPPKQKHVKRCYRVWSFTGYRQTGGGKVVWLTDAQLTFARVKYPKKIFRHVLEKDLLEEYKKYIGQTIE